MTAAASFDPFGVQRSGQQDPSQFPQLDDQSFDYLGAHGRAGVYGSDLIHMGARLYDPAAGRFISRDSLDGIEESPQTQNPYAYGLNGPGWFKPHKTESHN